MKPMSWKHILNWIILALWIGILIGAVICAINGTAIPTGVAIVAILCCVSESGWDVLIDYVERLRIDITGDDKEGF